jgi:serine/threonine-protein kinase
MDDDCLLRGDLHPSIRERLSRVRELAHGGVANLFGVARDRPGSDENAENAGGDNNGGGAWLIWEYVEGEPFSDFAAAPSRSLRELAAAGRETALVLDLLHMQGIVHGAIGGGNVIVTPTGSVRLTHVSPLLYSDPGPDAEAVVHLLESAVAARGEAESPLGTLLAQGRTEKMGLRPLAARLAALVESRELDDFAAAAARDDRPRRRARYAAAIVACVGLAIGVGAWRAAGTPALRAKVQEWFSTQSQRIAPR